MALDERAKLAFASVSDLTKQLITLGTGVLTLEVGFAKVFFEKAVARHWQVQVSWVALMVSVAAGVWVLMALAGQLAKSEDVAAGDLYGSNIRIPALVQVLAFLIGMVFTAWFGLAVTEWTPCACKSMAVPLRSDHSCAARSTDRVAVTAAG